MKKFNFKDYNNNELGELITDLDENNLDLPSEGAVPNLVSLIRFLSTKVDEAIEEINLLKGEFPSQTPSEDWTINQIKSWLDQENIDYSGITLKSELLALTSGG